jgi:hypothetical protein
MGLKSKKNQKNIFGIKFGNFRSLTNLKRFYFKNLEAYPECGLGLSKMSRQQVYEYSSIPYKMI